MGPQAELLTKLLLWLAIVFILGRVIAPFLFQFLREYFTGNKNKNSANLDVLIERQKKILSRGLSKKSAHISTSKEIHQKTVLSYKSLFQKVSNAKQKDQDAIEDIKKILSLIDEIQWGGGPEFTRMSKKFAQDFGVEISPTDLFNTFKNIVDKDFLLSRSGPHLPLFNEIMKVVELNALLDKLFTESLQNNGPLLNSLSKRWRVSPKDISRALTVEFYPKKDKILSGSINLKESDRHKITKLLITEDKKFFQSRKNIMQNLVSQANFFSALSPINPPKDKNDISRAREIFYADDNTPLEEIKTTYKKMALKRHPDKLSSMGIPQEFEKVATKNFSAIQQAYEILLTTHS